ncbi:malate dehydrogenase [Rhizoctonia solani]|uniref:malate dehydrogenase n=1 Tax=Rhizoctonia solani TaxID=456999 RepID=A0A8H7III0_9AGAM|nr:malate dehydrogenase [Rhizoctonia solani]
MLSTPSTPEPVPRELGPPHEDELAQPISKVPMQMLVQEDSSSIRRAASEHGTPREGLQQHGGMGTSLPPPPRTRPMAIRQHSYSASASDRDGSSEGRRSDESGKRGHGALSLCLFVSVMTSVSMIGFASSQTLALPPSHYALRAALRTIPTARAFSTSSSRLTKVAVLGGIGQPLSLLLKQDKLVSSLSLYDIRGAPGVAADVSHVDTPSTVKGYPQDKLSEALQGVKVVVIPAGVPRKPGMSRDDLFNTNAGIVRDLAQAVADNAPDAHILIISNPTVPIAAEVLKKAGKFDPKRLFGVTTLDVVRAARFLSEVDGAATPTRLRQSKVGQSLQPDSEKWKALVNRIQYGGDEVVKAKDGAGSATLSMAYAAAKFTNQLLRALNGEKGIVAPTFVKSPLYEKEGVEFFSSAVELGTNGVAKIHPVGNVSPAEQKLIDECLPELKKNIAKGANLMEIDLDDGKKQKHDEEDPGTEPQSSDVHIIAREGKEDELQATLTHQIELEIALRKRVARVIEARIAWAEQLKKVLTKGQGKQVTPDPVQARQQAIESFRALHAPLDLDPHTTHPEDTYHLCRNLPHPIHRHQRHLPNTSILSPNHPTTHSYSCPVHTPHGPSYAYASHDEFLRSPGASTLIDAFQDPTRYAQIINEGIQVKLGGVRGLKELFESAVEGVGLGLSADTGELARLLGRKARKGEIRAFGQDEVVDIESVDEPVGNQRWKKYGVWAPRRRNRVQEENDDKGELDCEPTGSCAPDKAYVETPAIHVPNASRFHIKKRIVISDWSRSLRRGSVQPGGPTHRWMIRLNAPSYSDHITTFLSALRVQCASIPPVFEDTITCSSPPFAISRLSKQPFLARVTLIFADDNTKDVVITHWIDLDPVRSGNATLGVEQIFDVELDKNAQLLPPDTSNVPNKDTCELIEETVVKSEPQEGIYFSAEASEDEKVPLNEEPEPVHERIVPVLCKLRTRLPLTLEDAARFGHVPQVPYMLFDSHQDLLDAVHGRRKAIEMAYTRALLSMLKTEYSSYDADMEPGLVESLTTTQLYAHLLTEKSFPRPELSVARIKMEEASPVPDELVLSIPEGIQYCGVCGLDISRHPPTSRILGPSKFACIASGSFQRPTCDIGLWTTLRPLREIIQRVNLAPGAITTLGSRASLRGASQLVDCAPPHMTLAFHALTRYWRLKTFEYASKRHNANPSSEIKLPLELLGVDESHVDRTLAPHALLTLIAQIFIKRTAKEALRARSEMLGGLSQVPEKSILTTTHVSRALMDGRNSAGWLPLMAVARIGIIHSDTMHSTGV